MRQNNTIMSELLRIFPRYEFEKLEKAHKGNYYEFLTNNFTLAAKTIADIYKSRWQIELFFKWIKQNLKIKSFLGTTPFLVVTDSFCII